MKRIFSFFLLFNITTITFSQSNEWVSIATSVKGAVWMIRISDLLNETNFSPKVWFTIDHSEDKSVSYRTTKQLISFDCIDLKSQTLQVTLYNGDDSIENSWDNNYSKFSYKYVVPDSVLESAMLAACPSLKS